MTFSNERGPGGRKTIGIVILAGKAVRRYGTTWPRTIDLMLVAWWWGLAEIGVRVISLARLAPHFGVRIAEDTARVDSITPSFQLDDRERQRLEMIWRVARRWPAGPGPCLRQSLVTGHVLRRHSPLLHLGVIRAGADDFLGHAWIELSDGREFGRLDEVEGF